MAMQTAAAILTTLALEQNTELKLRLNAVQGEAKVIAVIMPLFRQILSELEKDQQSHDKFPSAVAGPSSGRSDKAPARELENTQDAHAEGHRHEEDEIGGEG